MKVALFVEGSSTPPPPRGVRPLDAIWNGLLGPTLGLQRFEPVVPISKRHLVALDPRNPPMSGAGEDLAQLMRRVLDREGFEAAVIAWDIVPAWNPDEAFCRWQETMDLHRFLAASDALPPAWRQRAEQRHAELSERPVPAARRGPVRLAPHAVLPLCMEPMFEGLLIGDESAIRRALDVGGARVPDWPSRGWGDPAERRPDANLLGPAIHAVQNLPRKSRPAVCRQVRGDWIRNKDGWGELLLRRLLEDPQAMYQVKEHPISKRLREMLSP